MVKTEVVTFFGVKTGPAGAATEKPCPVIVKGVVVIEMGLNPPALTTGAAAVPMPVIVMTVVVMDFPATAGGAVPVALPARVRSAGGAIKTDFAVVGATCGFAGAASPPRRPLAAGAAGDAGDAGCAAVNGERVGSAGAGGASGARNGVEVCAMAGHAPMDNAMPKVILRHIKAAKANVGAFEAALEQ